MRFEEAYDGFQKKRLAQEEAASLLGVCSLRGFTFYFSWSFKAGEVDQRRPFGS